nr:MAG TPA: PolyVal ADP-Ribosyltransferase [Caudoviricetes sp.]
MNDDFSFDGANAANMPLDLSFSSQPLPEGEAATGFHLPEITPAQEQAKADSPKLVDEWKQDVQMLDEGGLNGLEESAGLETGNFMDTKSANEGVYGTFRPSLTDMDSVRHQWNAMIREKESLKRDQERKRQNMIITLLRADKNDREAINRMAEHWGRDSVWRLESSNDEERSYMLGMRLAEVLGDGDSDAGFQIYKNTHDLWGKGIISPEQIWQDFRERGKDIVEREDRQRVERERRISDLNGVVSRYVSGEMDSLSADERMALFHAGVSVASMEKARRGVRLIESFEQDSRLYNDDIADDLFGVIGNDDDSLMMLCNLLRNRSRSTANDRLGMGGAEKRADEAYREVMENSNPLAAAVAGQAILNAKMVSGVTMTGKVAGVKTKRSLERALQNMSSHEDARMKAAAFQIAVAKARQMGLSDEEAFEMAGVQEQERRELQQKRNRFFSALTTALEGGEDDYFSSDEASSLSKVGYHLGSMTGDTAPWFLPYAGPLIGLNTSIQRRREEGFMLGLDVDEIEKRAFWFGAADTAEEMIGFHALFKATPLYKGVRKLLRTEKGAGVRALVSGSPAAQYALQGVAGTVEEGILEPTAGYLMRSAINPMLDDERGKQTWEQYTSELSQITSGEQGLALLAFSFGLSGLNYSQLSRAAREFRLSLKNYEALGGTAQGYLEAREEKTAEGFLNKALSHLHDSWMEDPQASMERASAAAGERLSGERIESLRELDAWRAAEDAGMVPRVEPAEQEGMFRVYAPARGTEAPREDASVSGEGQEEGAPSYTLMDGEQMTAYLQAFVDADMEHAIVGAQHLLAGDVTVGQALAQGRFDAAEVITRTVRDEQTGAERVVIAPETLGQMKARADMAMAAIRALEAEGVSYEEAAARMDASLSEHISLGTLVQTWEEAQERIRTEQARNPEFKAPAMDAPFSNAYVTKVRRGDTFRRVLRYARGSATVEDLMEETMEQAVISWQAEQGLSWDEFCAMLQEAQRVMNELFPEARGEEMQFIHLDAGKPVTAHDAIEAFSKIGRSRWLADAVRSTSLPSWLRKLLNHLVRFLGYFKARVELGEMVRQAEEQGVFSLPVRQALAVMLDAGNALYRDQQGDLMELSMERARAQAGLDAMFGAGVATEARTLEDELAESKAQDEERRQEAEDEARAPENSPEAQEARREREQARVEALGEPDGSGVFNGAFIEVQEGVRQGFIEKSRLTLCPDVPQFKQGADEQTGVVNPIVGAWQRNAAPISVWRRKDGALQVISGRHRFNACTDEDINCTVYDEAAGFDLDWAQTHDVENNIRDGQASLFEIARYVSRKRLTKEEAVERGIFRKGQSRRGVELGLYGCSDLLDALGNELVSPDDAWRVAMAFRNQNEVQRAGLRALMEGKSWQAALAVMQVAANMDRIRGLAEAAGMTFETDLFGNSHAEEYFSRLAQYAAARVSELTREISSISGASRRPETARKYGVDVRDAAALEAVVKDLKAQRARWQNFGLHEDLIKEANDAVMVELGVKTREEVDRENGVLPLEAPEQEAGSADTGMLQLSQDVSRMLDAALTRGATPAEDEAPAANFSLVSISSGDVVSSAAGMRARLKPLQGKVFVNKNTGIQAVIEARVSGKTVGKAGASQMSVANLKALGFSAEEARRVHYTAATRIHELFENAEDGFFEEAYKQDASKAGAYHFFNTVDIEGIGAFDVNVTAIKYVKEQEGNVLYTLELTIENPATRGAASREGRLPTPFKDGVSTRNLSSYRSFVEKEKAAVRKKAESDGTFMKAPNGKDTNLTEDQWLSVRTEAFKSWFGDWENDPSNASKVVDANGEPLVVYHGTPHEFTVFNKNAEHVHDAGYYGKGFYFTFQNSEYFKPQIARSEAGYYGNRIISAFLNIKNPFDFSSLLEYQGESIDLIGTQSFAFLYNIAKKFPELEGVVEMPGNGRWIDGSFVTNEKEYSFQEYVNLVESIHDRLTVQKVNDRGEEKLYIQYWDGKSWHEYKDKEDGKTYRYKETVTIYRNVEPDLIENMKKNAVFAVLEKVYGMDGSYSPEKIMTWNPEITEAIKAHGHDGIVQSPSGDEVVAFEPTQIKSATDNRGTFDAANPDITFSIIGEKAESFQEYHNNGLSYTDPADGKRKAIIDSRGVRLRKEHVSVSEGGHVNVSLAAALDFPELFRAYPELRRLRVDFYRDSGSGTGGFTDPREHYIAVNVARGGKNAPPGMVLDTILHEVQHVIQGYEGFAQGAGSMSREQALAYLGGSMGQLAGRDDAWAKEALPRLERMRQELEAGTLQPAFVYVFSHGEQEARLAGRFEKNSEGVVMSGLNGFRLLDAPQFSIPLTGNITELGGITFGAGRFGRMADRVLAPNGDWLYDEMVFRMRAAAQRSVNKLNLYETGDRERGLELLAEAQELIATVERFLPHTYGFGLEPYKIWLNVFSLLYGNSGKMAPDEALSSALSAIPMEKWPEIMAGSVMKHFWGYVKQHETLGPVWEGKMKEFEEEAKFTEAGEKAAELDKRRWEFFIANGAEFLEKYGQVKVYRLISKFMARVVEQIDRYRKDRTLGRIRRVAASVAPRTNPKGKPLRGKMDAESYRRLERCLRLLEMTESQYDEFFQKNFPEDAEEGKRWEDLAPDALVLVTLPDAEGRLEEVAVTQREFEVYACYERMDVNTAEKCGATLGELIATTRHAWENAAEKKKMEVAAMAAPLLQATGNLDDNRMATFRRKARLRALPKKPLSLFDYLMNFNQYMQALSSVGPFAGIARQFEERAARFNVQRQASEKEMLRFVHNTVAEIAGSADRYDIAEWIYEGRMKQDTGISVVEREPDWNRKANALYRERLLHLLRRKVKSHGLEAVQLYLREFKLSEDLKKEVNALFGHRRKEISAKQAKKALEHMERVFTQKEWERYGDQKVFVRERAEMLRSRTKYAKEGYQPKSFRLDGLSRMEAAYLVLLSEQADYTEALAERGFDAEVMDRLRGFAGDEVMRFAYALREKLNERSGQVQEMTERRYGTPFPLTENYFRAFFDVTMEAIDKSIADAASYGEAATGGKFGLIHARRKHQAHLDLEMDVCTAFMAAMTEQDLYLYGSEISRDLRALLNFKGEDGEAGRSLEVLLGRDAVGKLMAWADAFDRAGAESIRGHLDMNRLMNRLSGAAARVLLAGRVGTLTKQVTTVINAMYASDEIGLDEWLGAVRRYHAGKLVKPVREIEALPELDSRDKTRFSATLAAMGADEAGRRVSRLERWNREGMDLLERVDMKGNAISAAILYDAVYRKMKRETPDAAEAELDAAAMAEVRRSLSRKGQPMTQLQKSLAAQHRTWMQAGMLFLGGESINTMGNVFSLARSGQWGKAGLMWVSHGVVLALLNGLLNFMTDDEKRRRKREWWHALFDVVMGPVMGLPVVSGLAGEGVRQLAKLCGYHAFMPGNNLLVPFSNAADIGKAFSNAWKVFDGKERPWEDDALSFHELLRTAAAGTVAFSPRTTKGGAAAVGAALTMAALLNVTEFALKTVRSVQENGADWDKWVGSQK